MSLYSVCKLLINRITCLSAIFLFICIQSSLGLNPPKVRSTLHIPIIEAPSAGDSNYYVILFTGNGGWRKLVQSVTAYLNTKGISVLAINTKKYFLSKKSPAKIADDLEQVIDYENRKWGKSRIVLMGYSMGAEVLPFAVNNLKPDYLSDINDIIMIAPGQKATFKIKLADYFFEINKGKDIYTELKRMRSKNAYCICDDRDVSLCRSDLEGIIDFNVLTGGHHFNHDYVTLSKLIGKRLKLE
jgi:type IV secretory pathway VirJ component